LTNEKQISYNNSSILKAGHPAAGFAKAFGKNAKGGGDFEEKPEHAGKQGPLNLKGETG